MIRHVALFRWIEGTTPEQVAAVVEALEALPAAIPTLRTYAVGPDLALGEDRWDFAVIASFEDARGYHAYVDHPEHRRVADEVIAPIRAERAHVQIED